MQECKRRPELPYHSHVDGIAEYYNTISNAGFMLGACWCWTVLIHKQLLLSKESDPPFNGPLSVETLNYLILLLLVCGWCSAIHHSLCDQYGKYTIVLDWIPIASSLYVIGTTYKTNTQENQTLMWTSLSTSSVCICIIALCILLEDHVIKNVKAPWGHVTWHLTASIGITFVYLDWIAAL